MICAAVERDGGIIGESVAVERNRIAIRAALLEPDADVALVIGGTGPGNDDHSTAALGEAGELAIHGVARRCLNDKSGLNGGTCLYPGRAVLEGAVHDR